MSENEVKQEEKQNKMKTELPKEEKKKERPLFDKYKKDLDLSQFIMK